MLDELRHLYRSRASVSRSVAENIARDLRDVFAGEGFSAQIESDICDEVTFLDAASGQSSVFAALKQTSGQLLVKIRVGTERISTAEVLLSDTVTIIHRDWHTSADGDGIRRLTCTIPPGSKTASWSRLASPPSTFDVLLQMGDFNANETPFRVVGRPNESELLFESTNRFAGKERKSEIVLLIHGIRTRAKWQAMVQRVLEEIPDLKVVPIKYGFVNAFQFWCPLLTRIRAVRAIAAEIRNAKRANREAELSIIAHSFGTYAVSRILASESDLCLNRLVLCGCIINREYKWEAVSDQLREDVVNDYGTRDIWPVLAQSTSWGYGDTGRHSFGRGGIVIDRGHNFRHSDFFSEDFVRDYWLPLFKYKTITHSSWPEEAPTSAYVIDCLSWLPLKTIIGLAIGVVSLCWWLLF